MLFKGAGSIGCPGIILLFLLVQGSAAGEKPETLEAYFKSFAKENKIKPAAQDSWISADKGYHVIGSMMTTTLIGQFGLRGLEMNRRDAKYMAVGASLALGVTKEIYDAKKPGNRFSWKDLAADGVGIIIGVLLLGVH